jgi:hypothetical protein
MFIFPDKQLGASLVPIAIGAEAISLGIRPPTLEERLIDDGLAHQIATTESERNVAAFKARFLTRCRLVIAWGGVYLEDGSPVEFSDVAFNKLMEQCPETISQVSLALDKMYYDLAATPAVAA